MRLRNWNKGDVHWQTPSHKDVSSTPPTCHNSLTNSIISNYIKYTSDLPQFTDKLYHIKLNQGRLLPATIHWQILSHMKFGVKLACDMQMMCLFRRLILSVGPCQKMGSKGWKWYFHIFLYGAFILHPILLRFFFLWIPYKNVFHKY